MACRGLFERFHPLPTSGLLRVIVLAVFITLLGMSPFPSTGIWAQAARLEGATSPNIVQVIQAPGQGEAVVARALAMALESDPEVIAMRWPRALQGAAVDLAGRILAVMPRVKLELWGRSSSAAPGWLADHDRVTLVEAATDEDPPTPGRLNAEAVSALTRLARAQCVPVLVEDPWSGRLTVSEAAGQLIPLLSAGARVRLDHATLTGNRGRLRHLLRRLTDGLGARLELVVPARNLDGELAEELVRLSLERFTLTAEGPPHGTVQAALDRVRAVGVGAGLNLVYGAPGQDLAGLGRALEGWLRLGLDDLELIPCTLTPARAARHTGLVVAPDPPHQVLSHGDMDGRTMCSLGQCADLWRRLRPLVVGTGLVRALQAHQIPLLSLLQGLTEQLMLDGAAPRGGDGDPEARHLQRALLSYLRQRHGLDLEHQPERGQGRLVRSPGLTLRWQGPGRVITDGDTGRSARVGQGALRLLDRFGDPRTLHEVKADLLNEVEPSRRAALERDLRRTADKLQTMGFVVPAGGQVSQEPGEISFSSLDEFEYHSRMLADRARGDAYRRAIQAMVQPGQHVVEVGTGTGILAVWAAQAGARVTAIERYPVIQIARQLARDNGVDHRITLIRGRSDLVQLDEPGDLLITELVGNRVLNEGILETTLDCRRRLLRPGANLLPAALEIMVRLVRVDRFGPLRRELVSLGDQYSVKLGALEQWLDARLAEGRLIWEQAPGDDVFTSLSGDTRVIRLDLATMKQADFSQSVTLSPTAAGRADATLLSFRLELAPGVTLSSTPDDHDLHWSRPVHMLPEPITCRPGEDVGLEVRYQPHGNISISPMEEA